MHVAFVTRRYWPAIGGVERVAMSLGRELLAAGHDVTVIAQCVDEGHFGRMTHIIRENKPFASFVHEGVQVVQFRPSRRRRALLLPFLLELLPLGGRVSLRWGRAYTSGYYTAVVRAVLAPLMASADVVHVLGGEVMAVAAVETARWLGKPTAISPFAHPGHWGLDVGSVRAYRMADLVLATTHADAAVYRDVGVDDRRIQVVGLPVAAMAEQRVPGALSGTPQDAPLVVFLGARRPTKGVELLLEAAQLVWERSPEARFAFVGPGPSLGSGDERVLDVGPVPDDERAAWLARAQLLCLPSAGESFGLVVAEAWSLSTPVVVSDIPVLKELVDASGGGLACRREPHGIAEAISSLLADPGRAKAMGQAGHAYWRRQFDPHAVAARHVGLYERLISKCDTAARSELAPSSVSTPS
jgi:glycosyltransferase involved in cell wall biosynthesis